MVDRNLIRQNPELLEQAIARKGLKAPIPEIVVMLEERARLLRELEVHQAELNKISKSIGELMAKGQKEEAEKAKAQTKEIKEKVQDGEQKQRDLEASLYELELDVPNPPHESVPDGLTEAENKVVRTWGEPAKLDFEPKAHWDVATELGMLDLPRASKISGSGFAVYTGWGARLQRALFNFMIDHQTLKNGYREVYPPFMVLPSALIGTGQLPKFGEELYKLADDDLYLIPTAEVPVTNLYREEILDGADLTIKLAAFSGCFRREAGAAGKDTRGIQRMHQFDKVELVKFAKPEDSYNELEALVADAESVLQTLGLHYRVTLLCGGEMSFTNAKCYDLEVWCPGVGRYLEISSCSNFESFQARRANIRFRRGQGEKPEFVHTLNGSGLATPRLFAAILETFYRPDGKIVVPEPLWHYIGAQEIRV
ncbi:MAG: serine--tRNA ligase [Armatimonadetes bacterium]|nr:serine--tRNA ligase [Armatimonadota bacterium]